MKFLPKKAVMDTLHDLATYYSDPRTANALLSAADMLDHLYEHDIDRDKFDTHITFENNMAVIHYIEKGGNKDE